jgi:serine/threonine protein kinase
MLQRLQLQAEEATRYRDLLLREGASVNEAELRASEERAADARKRFVDLKSSQSQLLELANTLGRSGFPEVWQGLSIHTRSGALLSIESFGSVRVHKSPHIWVGERNGRSFVLKARRVGGGDDSQARRAFEKELFVLKRLRHPLVVQLEATFQEGDTLYLVLPFHAEGTMRDWLDRQGGPTHVDRGALKSLCRGVLQALTFLHSSSVVHGDLTLENILIDGGKPVLADFDSSEDGCYFDATQTSAATAPGTLLYTAPELFERGARLSYASDMFSFGVCVFLSHFAGAQVYLAPRATHVQLPPDRDTYLR